MSRDVRYAPLFVTVNPSPNLFLPGLERSGQILNFSTLFGLEDGKSVKDLPNRSEGVQYYPEFEAFDTWLSFDALQNVGKIYSCS